MVFDTKFIMNWQDLLSTDRLMIKDGKIITKSSHAPNDGVRSDFQMDYDRVVFSGAFRRLGRKTQVHPLAHHDHTHNRLTHSVEVASVGRSLGNGVGVALSKYDLLPQGMVPSDVGVIVQVACLAHDLGNPPFGHTGESALREWWQLNDNVRYLDGLSASQKSDVMTFEGNAHSLRIVASLEMYAHTGGMQLTCASLGTLLKYPWCSDDELSRQKGGKFNIYQSELALMKAVADRLGLPQISNNRWSRHPLSYLMEAADDICYALLDLEDAVELDLIGMNELEEVLSGLIDVGKLGALAPAQKRGAMRGKAISAAIDVVADTFMAHYDELLAGTFDDKDLIDACPSCVKDTLNHAKSLASKKIFTHASKLHTEIASFGCLGALMDLLVPAVHAKLTQTMNMRHKLTLKLLQDAPIGDDDTPYMAYMKVLDFVGGLTDNSAGRLARQLSGVGLI